MFINHTKCLYLHLIQDRDFLVVTGTVTVSPWKVAALKVRNTPLVVGRYFPFVSPFKTVGKPSFVAFVVEENELEVVGRFLPPSPSVEDEDKLGVGKPSFPSPSVEDELGVGKPFVEG